MLRVDLGSIISYPHGVVRVFSLYDTLLLFKSLLGVDYPYRSNNVSKWTSTCDSEPIFWLGLKRMLYIQEIQVPGGADAV